MPLVGHRQDGAAEIPGRPDPGRMPEGQLPVRRAAFVQRFWLAVMVLSGLLALAGCADRPGADVLREVTAVVPGAKQVTIYVATNRQHDPAGGDLFTTVRADDMSYAEFTISVPPQHEAGKIEWPHGNPDAHTDFVTVQHRPLDRVAFEAQIARRQGTKKTRVGVFVPGYNTNFQEALFRLAQMTSDAGTDAAPILFAWPSEGTVTGYVADKDAATASRDQLVGLLTGLAQNRKIDDITLIAHSMGCWLSAEALRQLRLTGKDAVIKRLTVVLAAPDIDVEVFEAQMAVIGPLSPPMTILVSRDDVALHMSSILANDRQRVGQIDVANPEVQAAARKANVEVVDISHLAADDPFKHNRYAALAAYYPKLADTHSATGGIKRVGAFVFDAVGTTVSAPFTLVGKAAFGE
ncbi:MAG: alpha/beta fold hydrolase [Ancalomicrobiaceae bacterium]|nr:alpha/beta fold hydrolase [Ancalomicrobiaceae bacterium]